MEGNTADPKKQGMIPRALEQVFRTSQDLKEKGWQVSKKNVALKTDVVPLHTVRRRIMRATGKGHLTDSYMTHTFLFLLNAIFCQLLDGVYLLLSLKRLNQDSCFM